MTPMEKRMSKENRQSGQLKNVSGGGHAGGTHFGQQPGDADKTPKEGAKPKNDGKSDTKKS